MWEIVGVHIGGCGVNIGAQFWSQAAAEHNIPLDGSVATSARFPSTYFRERTDGSYEPRCAFMDIDSTSLDSVCASAIGRLIPSDHFTGGKHGACNIFGVGFNTIGEDLVYPAFDLVRKEVERCDCLASFQMTSSVCGGTGSGFCAKMLAEFRIMGYICPIVDNYAVFPSPGRSEIVVEPYNAILSLQELSEHSDRTVMLDNKAMGRVCARYCDSSPSMSAINKLVAGVMSGVTACHRFPSRTRCSCHKLKLNLTPFPRMSFLSVSSSSLWGLSVPKSAESLVEQVFDPANVLCSIESRSGTIITAVAQTRGNVHPKEIEEQFELRRDKWSPYFVQEYAGRIESLVCDIPPPSAPLSCALLSNNTANSAVIARCLAKFEKLRARRAFYHHFTATGMEAMDFIVAEGYAHDIISDFLRNESATQSAFEDE